MIVVYQLAKILKDLEAEEVMVLQALEELTKRFEYIPVTEVAGKSGLETDNVLFYLSHLNKIKLIQRSTEHYLGYRLSRAGYDVLALHELASQDVVVSIGQPYGVGKESNVYRALDGKGQEVAVKFLRWGQTSFRKIRRLRTISSESARSSMDYSKQAAEREFTALRLLSKIHCRVPQPLALNRHVIVMAPMEGTLLLDIDELTNPQKVQEAVIWQVRLAYQEAQLIHGDLSEYNIFVDEEEEIILFDWPQWQPVDHPNAMLLLKRDVSYVLKFFEKRFRLFTDLNHTLNYIISKEDPECAKTN